MKSSLSGIFRSRHRSERVFSSALGGAVVAGFAWLAMHLGPEHREDLAGWLGVMAGDTTLGWKTADYVRGGLMITALAWVGIGIGLLVTRRWWCFESAAGGEADLRRFNWRFAAGLGLIILLALAIRWPRMELSFYNDEASWFRVAVEGYFDNKAFYDLESEDLPKFREVSWQETFWGNRLANNHALHSILARALYDAWQSVAGTPAGTIHEWPLRLPALLGGLLAVAAAGLLASAVTKQARAGLFAAFFLAVHPWHLRYSTEARGYGLAMGFAALTAFLLVMAMERRQWRWWLAYLVSQTALLWSYLGAIYLVFGLNAAALIFLTWDCFRGRVNPLRSRRIKGLLVSNALSAGLFFLAVAPNLAALRFAMAANPTFRRGPGEGWWSDVLSYLVTGMPWRDADPGYPANPAIEKYLGNPLTVAGLVVALVLLAAGAWHLWRRCGTGGRTVLIGSIVGIVLAWTVAAVGSTALLKWYVNYYVAFPAVAMGAGLNGLVFRNRKAEAVGEISPIRRTWQRMAVYGLLGLYASAVARPLIVYRAHPKEALRPAIELARGGVYPFGDSEEQLRPIVVGWWTNANIYDPHFRICHTPEALDNAVGKARREKRPLYFILGMRPLALAEKRDGVPVGKIILDRLERSGEFETVNVFPGLVEGKWRTTVFRLRPVRKIAGSSRFFPEKNLP